MKIRTNLIYMSIVLALGILCTSCSKGREETARANEITDLSNRSLAQVFNATVGSARNYVFVDGKPMTGAALAYGGLFPSAAHSFMVEPGLKAFLIKDTLSTSTQPPLSFAQNLQIGKNYTIFTYDTLTAIKQKTVINNIVVPDDTTARLRFANFVYAPFVLPAIDIFSTNRNANVATNLQVTDVTEYIPYESNRTDTLYVRLTGTTTNLMNITPPTPAPGNVPTPVRLLINPVEKRHYTVIFRGSYRAVVTTAATVRALTAFINY